MIKMTVILSVLLASTFASAASGEIVLNKCGVLKNSEGTFSKSAPSLSIVERADGSIAVKAQSLRGTTYEKLLMRAGGAGLQIRESANYRFVSRTNRAVRPGPNFRSGTTHTIYSKQNPEFKATCKR